MNLMEALIAAKLGGGGGGGASVTPASVLSAMEGMDAQQQSDARAAIGATDAATSIPDNVKVALLACFADVAWADDQGQAHYDALEAALYPLQSISAVYTQSGVVYNTDSLDSLKTDLVVTATYQGGQTQTVASSNYTLSGTLTGGTSTITVSYGGKTTTFNVTVTPILYPLRDGEYLSANGEYKFTISGGRHCKCEVVRSGNTTTHWGVLNCYNGDISATTSEAINNQPMLFTVPANTLATLKLKNLVNENNGGERTPTFLVTLRNANGTTSFLATGQDAFVQDVTVSTTPTENAEVGTIGFGMQGFGYKQGAYVEFDMEVTVGDDVIVGGH